MLLASRSRDSMRARSPLAAMAVMGSMREGKSTASANRGRERQVSQKTVNPAEERDREAANFAPRFWRRWRGGQFSAAPWGRKSLKTRLAAFGLRAAIPAAWLLYPHRHRCLLDFSRCVRNVGQRLEPHRDSRRKLRRAPRARPPPGNFQDCWLAWWAKAAASKPARPRTMEPEAEPDRDPELTAAGRTIPAVTLQAALAALAAGPNLPVPKEIGPMSAGNGEATPAPAAGQPGSVAPQPAADLPAAPGKTPAIELQAGLALPEPGVAPSVREGQTATAAAHPADWRGPEVSVAAGRNLPPPVESLPLSGQDGEPAGQSAVPSPEQPSSHALPPGGPAARAVWTP